MQHNHVGLKDVCCMHRGGGASVYYTNCAGDMPAENDTKRWLFLKCPHGGGEEVMAKTFTSSSLM